MNDSIHIPNEEDDSQSLIENYFPYEFIPLNNFYNSIIPSSNEGMLLEEETELEQNRPLPYNLIMNSPPIRSVGTGTIREVANEFEPSLQANIERNAQVSDLIPMAEEEFPNQDFNRAQGVPNLFGMTYEETPNQASIQSNNLIPVSNEGSSSQGSSQTPKIKIDNLNNEIFITPMEYLKTFLKRFGLNIDSINCYKALGKNIGERKKNLKKSIREILRKYIEEMKETFKKIIGEILGINIEERKETLQTSIGEILGKNIGESKKTLQKSIGEIFGKNIGESKKTLKKIIREILGKNIGRKETLQKSIGEILSDDYISKRINEILKSDINKTKKDELNYFLSITYEDLFIHYQNNDKNFQISEGIRSKINGFITLEEAIPLKREKYEKLEIYQNNPAFLESKLENFEDRSKKIIDYIKSGKRQRGKIKIFNIRKVKRKRRGQA